MIQEIIALFIVFLAIFYTIYSIVKTLRTKSSKMCGGTCSCGVKNEFNLLLKNRQGKLPDKTTFRLN